MPVYGTGDTAEKGGKIPLLVRLNDRCRTEFILVQSAIPVDIQTSENPGRHFLLFGFFRAYVAVLIRIV